MKSTSLVEFEEIVLDFLEQNKLQKVNLIGHSMGGALALYFAYYHPERVKHLYLIDSEGVYDNVSFVKMTWNFLRSHTISFYLTSHF